MGSGNSSPVKRVEVVETKAHQDVFELRFDHLAFGGTAAVIVLLSILLYWMYRKCKRNQRRSRRRRRRDDRSRSHSRSPVRHQCCHGQISLPMPWYPPIPTNQFPMMPMSPPWNSAPIYDTLRFSEISDSVATTAPSPSAPAKPPSAPARQPPPQDRQLPSPLPRAAQE